MSESDFDKGVAVKVSLPSSLVEGLQAMCDANGISKSDATKIALQRLLDADPLWINRRYFFEDVSQRLAERSKDFLKSFRAGTFVKLAGGISHFPASAQFFVGIVHRVQGEKLYVELPMYLSRPTSLLNSPYSIATQMSVASEAMMIIPRYEQIPNLSAWGGTTPTLIYEVNSKYIWEVEADPTITYM